MTNYKFNRRTLLKTFPAYFAFAKLTEVAGQQQIKQRPNIRWAQGWLLWRGFKGQTLTLRDALDDLRAAGADGIEFSPGSTELSKQGLTKESLKETLNRFGLTISGNYFSAAFYDPTLKKEIFTEAGSRFDLLKEFGAKNIIIGPPGAPSASTDRVQLIKQTASMLNELGKLAVDRGVEIGVHPHLNTIIETPPEIDVVMESTDPRYVHFSPDTGHIHLAGGEVLPILRKYRSRLNYFHFKDGVRPFVRPHFEANLRELGQGEINFPAIMQLLKEINYRGWINVEQDTTRFTPKKSSEISMTYVRERLKPIYT